MQKQQQHQGLKLLRKRCHCVPAKSPPTPLSLRAKKHPPASVLPFSSTCGRKCTSEENRLRPVAASEHLPVEKNKKGATTSPRPHESTDRVPAQLVVQDAEHLQQTERGAARGVLPLGANKRRPNVGHHFTTKFRPNFLGRDPVLEPRLKIGRSAKAPTLGARACGPGFSLESGLKNATAKFTRSRGRAQHCVKGWAWTARAKRARAGHDWSGRIGQSWRRSRRRPAQRAKTKEEESKEENPGAS